MSAFPPIADIRRKTHTPVMNASPKRMHLICILLGSFYLVALIPGTLLAWVGTVWVGESGRGWQTQVAAGALMVGWVALAAGSLFVWKAAKAKEGPYFSLGAISGLIAMACYVVFFMWGGRMLI